MKIAVIGAGKMGLPLACELAAHGAEVLACDIRSSVVDAINAGQCLIDEPGVPELLAQTVRAGHLRATTDTAAAAAESNVVITIVPAVLTPHKDIDTSILESVTRQVARSLKPGMMISYETTLPVGGTRRFLPILEANGLKAGKDFDLVFSPERVKSQKVLRNLAQVPKVVGGITEQAANRAADFYRKYLGAPVINVKTLEAAEMVKLAGMLYRDVNIALANELARYAEVVGLDIYEVIRAANTDGEAALLTPGIGVGGHCTPVYPYFMIRDGERQNVPMTLAARSRRLNDGQPAHMLDRLERLWQPLKGQRAMILGLGFRPQVKEDIFSPAYTLRDELLTRGAEVHLDDPLYTEEEITACGFIPGSVNAPELPEVLILNTAHEVYAHLDFKQLANRGAKAIIDGRALWSADAIRQAGLVYCGVGLPEQPGAFARRTTVPIAKPWLTSEEVESAADVIRSGWVTQGPQVAALEDEFAEAVGAKHACAVSSGTAALHLALLAVGVQPGDEVITVSHSYIGTANAIRYCGATPVFVDVDPGTFNINASQIEEAITDRTRAILCVHQMGMPCDLKAVLDMAQQRSLPVVEDAACALGSEIQWADGWERIGKPHGDIACFSFHPRKIITTGDGGMLTTHSDAWDEKLRLWRQHSMSVSATSRHASQEIIFESYPELGFNYRMTDIQAAVGREQLKRLPEIVARRRALAKRYQELLASIDGLQLPVEPPWARSNWQSYCVRLPQSAIQKQVMQTMLDAGVSTRPGIMCVHREPAYSCGAGVGGSQRSTQTSLAESERAQDSCIMLPLYYGIKDTDLDTVVSVLQQALAPNRAS